MSTSTTSDPLPVPALPRHHATPVQTGFAGPLPAVQKAEEELLAQQQQQRHLQLQREAEKSMEKKQGGGGGGGGGAVDLRGFAAGTASGITKLVVGASRQRPSSLCCSRFEKDPVTHSRIWIPRRTPVRRDQSPVTMHATGDLRRSVGLPQANRPV
jgi:hypothetical protein